MKSRKAIVANGPARSEFNNSDKSENFFEIFKRSSGKDQWKTERQ